MGKILAFALFAGISLFLLGYLSGRNLVNLGNVEQGELLSWSETGLSLEIEGRIKRSEREVVEKICVFSVKNGRDFYDMNGNKSNNEKNCQGRSSVNIQNDGSWNLKKTFDYQEYRIIRVEKIYKQNNVLESRSYIVFTIGRS